MIFGYQLTLIKQLWRPGLIQSRQTFSNFILHHSPPKSLQEGLAPLILLFNSNPPPVLFLLSGTFFYSFFTMPTAACSSSMTLPITSTKDMLLPKNLLYFLCSQFHAFLLLAFNTNSKYYLWNNLFQEWFFFLSDCKLQGQGLSYSLLHASH